MYKSPSNATLPSIYKAKEFGVFAKFNAPENFCRPSTPKKIT